MLEPEQSLHPLDGNNRQQRAAQNQPVETAQDSCDSLPETLYKPGCRHDVLLRMVLMFVAQTPDSPKGCDAMSTLSNLRPISVEAILCTPPSTISLRRSLERPSRSTGHWDRAYWNRLTNSVWRRSCLCEKSLLNGKNRFPSITRELNWTAAIGWTSLWPGSLWWRSRPSMLCCLSTRLSCSAT